MKRIVIVGATSGIGAALARIYIAQGYTVGLTGRREDLLRQMGGGHRNVLAVRHDVCDLRSSVAGLQALVARMGGMDLLVLCAGVGRMNPELDFAEDLPTLDTNVRGWTAVADWAFNFFRKQGYGQLAAITSIASLRGLAPAPAYSASKAYQAHFLEALRQRTRAEGGNVAVTEIRPGFVHTPLLSDNAKFFWVMPVDKAARQIAKAIERRKARATVTYRWKWIVPVLRMTPEWLLAHILHKP